MLSQKTILQVSHKQRLDDVISFAYNYQGLTRITSLDCCVNLTELNLSNNLIERLEGLSMLHRLKKLSLTSNRIRKLENMEGLINLEHLLIQDNLIESTSDLLALTALPMFRSLYLKNIDGSQKNPICSSTGCRKKILAILPNLHILDGERLRWDGASTPMTDVTLAAGGEILPKTASWLEGFSWGSTGAEIEPDYFAGRDRRLQGLIGECRSMERDLASTLEKHGHLLNYLQSMCHN